MTTTPSNLPLLQSNSRTALITNRGPLTFTHLLQTTHLFAHATPCSKGQRVILFAENREGWIYALYAIWAQGGVAVPADASSTANDLAYIIADCQPVAVWASNQTHNTAREALRLAHSTATIKTMQAYEKATASTKEATLHYTPQDTALIIYTSGTTGAPKGVMLSFANIIANIDAVSRDVPIFSPKRCTLVLLPLHHVLPLVGSLVAPLYVGGTIILSPSMAGPDIMQTLCQGKVNIIIGVPRLYQTIFQGIKKKIDASPLARLLYKLCQKAQCPQLSRLLFAKVHKKMGGHLDYLVCGGAALEKNVSHGLQTLGFRVLEGYGMTEFAPMICFTRPNDIIPGCAGKPLPCVDITIKDGEICAKGPNLMQGYYNKPAETAATLDSEGYLHTGDLGHIDTHGRVYITGRSKELIVLSNGKNVQPAEIEQQLESQWPQQVSEAAVTQAGDRLCTIIVPQKAWAEQQQNVATALKRTVLEPYNASTENYKKILKLVVSNNPLPRTRLDKLQRYKLPHLITTLDTQTTHTTQHNNTQHTEYNILCRYITQEKHHTPQPTDHIETDLALDSLDKVALQGFIEHTFGMTLKADTMANFPSLMDMAEHIAKEKTQVDEHNVDWHELLHNARHTHTLPTSTICLPLATRLLALTFKIYNHLQLKGQENIPTQGPYILAPNHQSYIDAALILAALQWQQVTHCFSYATEEHIQTPTLRFMATHSNVIIMEQKNLKDGIQKLAQVLQQGNSILIFPEGSRTHNGQLAPFKKTFAILAKEMQVPIIPVSIKGAFEAMPRSSHILRPKPITVTFLPPITPTPTTQPHELATTVQHTIERTL